MQTISLPLNTNFHYFNRYIRFIKKCQDDNSHRSKFEKHHIYPKSLYPEFKNLNKNKWNRANLTSRQHYIAHWMLWKAFPASNEMSYAFWNMGNRNKFKYFSSRMYESLRLEHSKKISQLHSGKIVSDDVRKKISQSHIGKILSEDHKNNIRIYKQKTRIAMCGENNPVHTHGHPMKGKHHSEDTKQKLQLTHKKKPNLICPHCQYSGKGAGMYRWHFNGCRLRESYAQ